MARSWPELRVHSRFSARRRGRAARWSPVVLLRSRSSARSRGRAAWWWPASRDRSTSSAPSPGRVACWLPVVLVQSRFSARRRGCVAWWWPALRLHSRFSAPSRGPARRRLAHSTSSVRRPGRVAWSWPAIPARPRFSARNRGRVARWSRGVLVRPRFSAPTQGPAARRRQADSRSSAWSRGRAARWREEHSARSRFSARSRGRAARRGQERSARSRFSVQSRGRAARWRSRFSTPRREGGPGRQERPSRSWPSDRKRGLRVRRSRPGPWRGRAGQGRQEGRSHWPSSEPPKFGVPLRPPEEHRAVPCPDPVASARPVRRGRREGRPRSAPVGKLRVVRAAVLARLRLPPGRWVSPGRSSFAAVADQIPRSPGLPERMPTLVPQPEPSGSARGARWAWFRSGCARPSGEPSPETRSEGAPRSVRPELPSWAAAVGSRFLRSWRAGGRATV